MRLLGIACLSMALASCGPLIDLGNKSADKIYALTYNGPKTMLSQAAGSVFVDSFMVSAGLDSEMILAQTPEGEQLQISGISWADQPADMLRDYLVTMIRIEGGMRAYGEGSLDLPVGCRLGVHLNDFQLDSPMTGDGNNLGTVRVGLNLTLLQINSGKLLGEYQVSQAIPVADRSNDAILNAFQSGTKAMIKQAAMVLKPHAASCIR